MGKDVRRTDHERSRTSALDARASAETTHHMKQGQRSRLDPGALTPNERKHPMKRVPVTSDQLERIAWNTRREIEFTASEAFCRVGEIEYHADLAGVAAQVMEVPC